MRLLLSLFVLALMGLPLQASAEDEAATVEEKIQALETKRARLVEEREAARMRANIYVLPRDKLEVEAKTKEIEEVDRELEALRKEAAGGGAAREEKEAEGPR